MKVGETWVGRRDPKEFVVKITELGEEPNGKEYVKATDEYRGPFIFHRKQFVSMFRKRYQK